MSDKHPYIPIDCGFHDRLEDFAVRRKTVDIAFDAGRITGIITDVYARDGADWMTVQPARSPDDTLTIRLDRLARVVDVYSSMYADAAPCSYTNSPPDAPV